MLGLTASLRELLNARAADVAVVDANGDQLTNFPVSVTNTPTVTFTPEAPPATAVLTSVASSVSSVTILASNASRKKFIVYNDSTKTLKLAYAATATASAFTHLLAAGQVYESELHDYSGIVTGIWSAVNGNARVTELTA